MPFVNKNPHPVRVRKPVNAGPDTLVRLRPGQVISADGEFADNLENTPGVEHASDSDERSWERERERYTDENAMVGEASRLGDKLRLSPLRVALRHATIAAPLRRVVGDDAAPYGPPSGTVTSKGQIVEGLEPGHPDRVAFAENEAVPGETIEHAAQPEPLLPISTKPTSEEIHNAQVANVEAAEELIAEAGLGAIPRKRSGDGDAFLETEEEVAESDAEAADGEAGATPPGFGTPPAPPPSEPPPAPPYENEGKGGEGI